MYPILYNANETQFTSNGVGVLVDAISCEVSEERNGTYELVLEYPVTGQHYEDIKEGMIIGSVHDDRLDVQPFVVYGHETPIDGIVTFRAHHISYNMGGIIVKPFNASDIATAFSKIPQYVANSCPFTFWTNKSTVANFRMTAPMSLKEMLGGVTGSILDVFGGGEYEYDKFAVKLYQRRGSDTNVEIMYGKNLSDYRRTVDISATYDAVCPYWIASSDSSEIMTLPEMIVTTPLNNNRDDYVALLDLSQAFTEKPSASALRAEALRQLESAKPWLSADNITVDFVALWQTEDYKNIVPLEHVRLCDTVLVTYPDDDMEQVRRKVVKVTFNALLERYTTIELGELQSSFSDVIKASIKETVSKTAVTRATMETAIDVATELISGGLGGYVVLGRNANGQPNEILILDSEDISTAVNVLRINRNGIGFSSTGYSGTYTTAWTLDGGFVADFITSGTLQANLIKAGILSDNAGKNSWNLNTGELVTASGSVGDWRVVKNDVNRGTSAQGGHIYNTCLYSHAADANYEYEIGLKNDGASGTVAFYVKRIALGAVWENSSADTLFYISTNGKLYGNNVEMEGKITAGSGSIGDWRITSGRLEKDNTANGGFRSGMQAGIADGTAAFYAGCTTPAGSGIVGYSAFYVTQAGKLYCSNGTVAGDFTIRNGKLGDWVIATNDANRGTSAQGGHIYDTAMYGHAKDSRYEYEFGFKTDNSATTLAMYIKRIALNATWENSNATNLFYIRNDGKIFATLLEVSGSIDLTNPSFIYTTLSDDTRIPLIGVSATNNLWVGSTTFANITNRIILANTIDKIYVYNSSGGTTLLSTAVSDLRLKHDVQDLLPAHNFIMGLNPKRFKLDGEKEDRYYFGFVAQEVRPLLEETLGDSSLIAYNSNSDDGEYDKDDEDTFTYSMDYTQFVAPLVQVVQEQERRIAELEDELMELMGAVKELTRRLAK